MKDSRICKNCGEESVVLVKLFQERYEINSYGNETKGIERSEVDFHYECTKCGNKKTFIDNLF